MSRRAKFSHHEVGPVGSQLVIRLEEVPFDGGVFKCPVRPLGLSLGPWAGKPMVDVQLCAGAFERMRTERLLAFHRMIRVHDQTRGPNI